MYGTLLFIYAIILGLPPIYSLASILSIISYGMAIYMFLRRYKVNTHNIVELGGLFLLNWLDKRRDIEHVFLDLSTITNVSPHIMYCNDIAFIYPDIHFGPFDNVGSSSFPRIIEELLRNNYETIVFHGMGSHDRNIASYKVAEHYAKMIVDSIKKNRGTDVYPGIPFRVKYRDWDILVVPFTQATLVFLSRPRKGIDDLPYSVQEYAFSKSLTRNQNPVLLIDCHNREMEEDIDINEVLEAIDLVIDKLVKENLGYTTIYKIGKSSIDVTGSLPGVLGPIRVVILDIKGVKVALVYIPGNNMEPGVRDKIISIVKQKNIDYVEVLTNDEHTETGIIAGAAYIPVKDNPRLYSIIEKLVDEALKDLSPRKLKYTSFSVKLDLMASGAWKLAGMLEKVFKKTIIIELSLIHI